MEIITGTAKDLVGNIFNYAFATVGRQMGYLIHYKRNLEILETELSKLSAAKDTVSTKITVAEAKGEKIYPGVKVWQENVARVTKEAEQLLKDKQQATVEDANNSLKDDGQPKTKCVLGICPNPVLRSRRSKKSLTLVEHATKLINEEKELDISFETPKDLQTEVEKLSVAKEKLAEKVDAAEVKGEKIHADVLDWLKRVTEIVKKAKEFLKDKHRSTEDASEFMKDDIQAIEKPITSSSLGRKESTELLPVVTELYEMREKISYILPPEDKCMASDQDYEEFDSRTLLGDKILTELGTSSSSNMIKKLKLTELPNFARFCTAGSCIDFPLLEELHVQGESATYCGNVLFDEKVRFPSLKVLKIIMYKKGTVLKEIWHNQLAPGSFCRLRELRLTNCNGLSSIFSPSMIGRLSGLETLDIYGCESASVVFDESGESTGTTTTHLKDGQNLKLVVIKLCPKLGYVFPASMVSRGLQQLEKLEVTLCFEMSNVVGKEEGAVESTTHPRFIFPKVKAMRFDTMDKLKSFYPAMHTSEWPSLQRFEFSRGSLVTFAAEVSHFLETQLHAPTEQPFFLIDKGSFPVLEELVLPDSSKILYGPSSSPIKLMFPKLNSTRRAS